jgi:SAM-dependent methyltransferase
LSSRIAPVVLSLVVVLVAPSAFARADDVRELRRDDQEPYKPRVGQAGKDVVWVPTPPELVEQMLDLARVTKDDFVIDLGSGDGRNIIAAARRGARGLGIEFNADMVALSRRLAQEQGVADRATFVQGDMYEADISEATVMAIYLLPANLEKLLPKFQGLTPGARIVSNTFGFQEWDPDARATVEGGACSNWCEALLWIVPARAAGEWRVSETETLTLTQLHQVLYGSLRIGDRDVALSNARMRGYDIAFTAGDRAYTGRLKGDTMDGTVTSPAGTLPWRATRGVAPDKGRRPVARLPFDVDGRAGGV